MVGNKIQELLRSTRPDFKCLPGGWEPEFSLLPDISVSNEVFGFKKIPSLEAQIIKNVLTKKDCEKLINLMDKSPNFEAVSVQGRKDIPDTRIGSTRTTIWSPDLASQLWCKIKGSMSNRIMDSYTATDWWQGDKTRTHWKPVAMSPMLRFMRYESGGQHYAHYDAGFIYEDDNFRTLQSVVIYLTTANTSGATRFVKDNQNKEPIWDRNHADWIRAVRNEEIDFRCLPKQGSILIFDHRICHDVEPYEEAGPRIIIRGDIVFEAEHE